MTDREVMQQALDAWDDPAGMKDLCVAMDALRTALEQQAEPVAYDKTAMNSFVIDLYDSKMKEGKHGHYESMFHVVHQAIKRFAPPQQQAEPVAYFDFQELKFSWAKHMKIGPVPVSIKVEPMKLYTTPPQRKWVGLTDEDVNRESAPIAQQKKLAFHAGMYVAQKILKEKNSD